MPRTLINPQRYLVRDMGTCLTFDGVSNRATLGSSNFIACNATQSLSFFIQPNFDTTTANRAILSLDNNSNSQIGVYIRSGALTVTKWTGTVLVSATAPAGGTKHHVGYTFDGTTHTLYLDGVSVGTSTVPANTGTPNAFLIGNYSGLADPYYLGLIDDLRYYTNRLLTPAEMLNLCYTGITGTGDANLNRFYQFNERFGTSLTDDSGNGNTGTIVGALFVGSVFSKPRQLVIDYGFSVNSPSGAGNSGSATFGDNFNYTTKVTLMGWFVYQGSDNLGNFPTFASKNGNAQYFLILNPSLQLSFNFNASAGGGEKSSGAVSTPLIVNQWYFFAGTYDSTAGANNLCIYIYDFKGSQVGINKSTQTASINVTTGAFQILHDNARGYNIQGFFDEVSVWNRALTVQEIEYFIANKSFSDTTSLGGYWKCDEGAGTTLIDSSGNGINGTLTGYIYSTNVVSKPRTLAVSRTLAT